MNFRLGRLDDARRQFEDALRLEPGNQQARQSLEQLQSLGNQSH
jgi:Flp pilus assembly protein TadD